MTNAIRYADMAMTISWLLIYVMVLCSTIKTQHPAMPLIFCVLNLPWELITACGFAFSSAGFSYIAVGYLGYLVLDLGIACTIIFSLRYHSKKQVLMYSLFFVIWTTLVWYCFRYPAGVLYTNFANTLTGIVFWIFHTARKNYPHSRLNMVILVSKLFADVLVFVVYNSYDNVVLCISVLMIAADILHIIVFLCSAINQRTQRKK